MRFIINISLLSLVFAVFASIIGYGGLAGNLTEEAQLFSLVFMALFIVFAMIGAFYHDNNKNPPI